jgi:hypothetical protein
MLVVRLLALVLLLSKVLLNHLTRPLIYQLVCHPPLAPIGLAILKVKEEVNEGASSGKLHLVPYDAM